jgi:hypothetical protein
MKKLILSLLIVFSAMAYSQGTIPIPSIIGLPAALAGKVDKVTGKSLVADTLSAKIQQHVTNTANPHSTTKAQVGLGNVDNTSDVNKPISSATQTALNGKQPTGTYSTDIHANITALNAVQGVNHGDQTDITGNAGTATKLQTARTINGVAFDGTQNITVNAVDATSRVASSLLGAANGVATLDANGIILTTQLPSYIDDVLEYNNLAAFPGTGETGKIYVAKDTNKTYRWSGSVYVYITSGAVDAVNGYTGVVSLSKSDIGLSNVDNTSDANKPVSTAMQSALNGKQASGTYSTDIHSNITALNDVLGSNHGDETLTSIKTKLGAASSSNSGYLTNTDFSNFSGKQNALGYTPWWSSNHPTTLSGYGITDTPWTSYLPLSGGTMSNANLVSNLNANYLEGKNKSWFIANNGYPVNGEDLNTFQIGVKANGGIPVINAPNNNYYGTSFTISTDPYYGWQMYQDASGQLHSRSAGVGTWNSWRTIYDSGNLTNTLSTNYIPKWNGSSFVNSTVKEIGGVTYWGGSEVEQGGLTWDTGWAKVFSTGSNELRLASGSGTVRVVNTGASTSPTTGAFVIGGGLGIGGKLFVGSDEQSDMDGTTINTGSIKTYGGISAVKNINSGGDINAFGNIASYGTITASGYQLDPIYQSQFTSDGSTSGNMVCSMPFQTGTYKKVIIHTNNLIGDATYTFPTGFVVNPTATYFTSWLTLTYTNSYIQVSSSTNANGFIVIEGY